MKRLHLTTIICTWALSACAAVNEFEVKIVEMPLPQSNPVDTLPLWLETVEVLRFKPPVDPDAPLTEDDYLEVAQELGIEVASLHAVVDVEAGHLNHGFWDPGKPVVYFSLDQFRRFAAAKGINIDKFRSSHPYVFSKPPASKFSSPQAAVQARVDQAMAIDAESAIKACFWGMFQIGGFNWKLCGATSAQDFYQRMCQSERSQIELFVSFLRSTGLDKPLQAKDWARFARGYNGPSWQKRGYHTKLARAYAKHSK